MPPQGADTPTAPGTAIAGHRIVGPPEREGSDVSYRAVASNGTPVVLRVLELRGQGSRKRFEKEARALREVSHPALAPVAGYGEAPEGLWLTSPEVEGTSLRGLLADGIAPIRTVRLLGELADGIDAAHAAGVVHGDVRPENVIVQGRPAAHAVLVGFRPGAKERKPAADVRALSRVLEECLTSSGTDVPAPVRPVLERGRSTDPSKAYGSAAELIADAARAVLQSEPAATPRPAPAPAPAVAAPTADEHRPKRTRPGRLVGGLAALLVIAAAGVAGYAVSDSSEPDRPPPPQRTSAGALAVTAPGGWKRSPERTRSRVLRDTVTLRRTDPPGEIVAGLARGGAAALDPSRVARSLAGPVSRPQTVRLGGFTALRFEGARGRGPQVVYVASTSAGAPAVACTGRDVSAPCGEAVRGLGVRGARPYDPAAGIAWKNGLASEARRLRRRRAAALARLRRAANPAAQAAAAGRVARTYSAAAARVRRAEAPPQAAAARRRVLARLLDADRAYRSLARSARAGDEDAFKRAQARIRRADRRLRVTLRSL